MKFRWTMQELQESSDSRILRGIISERMSELNCYSPLKERLQKLYNKFENKVNMENKNITFDMSIQADKEYVGALITQSLSNQRGNIDELVDDFEKIINGIKIKETGLLKLNIWRHKS